MSIKGINNLIKKLDKISNIETKHIVKKVATEIQKEIKSEAKKFSDTSYLYVKEVDVRDYGLSCFIDVGLSSKDTPFELWKPLWFQHWGFFNYGWNFKGQYYIKNNQLWFDKAVARAEGNIKLQLKQELRKEVRKALN